MAGTRATEDETPRSARGDENFPVEPQLFLVLECDRLMAGGARYSLAGARQVVLGRGPQRQAKRTSLEGVSELRVEVPSKSMSSNHARLARGARSWVLDDLGSRNGTYVNGVRVASCELSEGDVIELGRTFFIVRTGLSVPPHAPIDVDTRDLSNARQGLATLIPE